MDTLEGSQLANCIIPKTSFKIYTFLGIPSFLLSQQLQVEHDSNGIDSLNPFVNPLRDLVLLAYQVYLCNLAALRNLETPLIKI